MLNDQLIGSYLDGELDQEKRALVEYWLVNDNGAAARLERMRGADALIRRAIPKLNADALDPVAALIMAPPSNVVNLRPVARVWVRRAAALAAACVIGVLAGRVSSDQVSVAGLDPHMRLSPEIERILDTAPSGQSAPVLGGEVQVALSVQTESGALCRQFRATSGSDAVDAVACQEGGQWRLVVQTAAADEAASYNTASAAVSPVDAAIAALGGAVVLHESEERALIAAGWRK